MNKNKFLIIVAALAATSNAFTQQASTGSSSAGLLGQKYVEVGLFAEDFRGDLSSIDNGYGGGLGVNFPLTANFDATFGYAYERVSDNIVKLTVHTIAVGLTGHTQYASVKPFASATIGYVWTDNTSVFGLDLPDDDDGAYSLSAGVEIPLGASTTLTVGAAYTDSFDSDSGSGTWTYGASLDHWFTEKFGAGIGVAFVEDDSVVYGLSARFRF